ncbi:KH domain-containing protein [Furfurilactobacillus rossiae]|uniref:RNA-binding protein KhpA n=1 Tax=Furfurilactobacillus rossiae DSM 15814 TaxID=1114972 RepID=A0A0R1RJX4_9LACO|nr:KH domain-containing protein [Furfurilactobacillus rossiae]KRL57293.1 hypothetical protein FD35_GL000304 [Furfurilactobacillus rossiae DSM 15814]MCF6164963.1 KH domain-containing protein [Furfurilactobacillus rossiae]QFR65832.1 KH domain-containing protein [Furfurilactobacillus rossiae]QLE61239.1 KH domain RNA binding protein YlqC [Furfurilactobacillus rossiae]QLE64033.1 KH RNA binding protein YlqC [Furfurilactobacillus rossiae]
MSTNQNNRLSVDAVASLIQTLVQPLVSHPDAVSVQAEQGERFMNYSLTVAPDDIGEVIGRHGQVAQAIRTLVYSIRTVDQQKVRLIIVDENK